MGFHSTIIPDLALTRKYKLNISFPFVYIYNLPSSLQFLQSSNQGQTEARSATQGEILQAPRTTEQSGRGESGADPAQLGTTGTD